MLRSILFLALASALAAQAPSRERFYSWKLVSAEKNAELNRYEYVFWNGVDDGFMGTSPSPIKVHLSKKVKVAVIEPLAVYVIDEENQIQKLEYAAQYEMVARPRWWRRVLPPWH